MTWLGGKSCENNGRIAALERQLLEQATMAVRLAESVNEMAKIVQEQGILLRETIRELSKR
jgi:hypothetical protein